MIRSLLVRPQLKLVSKCAKGKYRYNTGRKFAYPLIRRGYTAVSATHYGVAGSRVPTRKEARDSSHTNSAGENWLGMSALYRSLHRGEASQGGVTTKSYPIPQVRRIGVSSVIREKVQASVRSGKPPPQKGLLANFHFFAGAKVPA